MKKLILIFLIIFFSLASNVLKAEADKLINEIENNTDHTEYDLRMFRDRLLDLNESVRVAIQTEEKRIADIKKAQEKIDYREIVSFILKESGKWQKNI